MRKWWKRWQKILFSVAAIAISSIAPHGSAGEIAGTTLILSIFADDSSTAWNESDTADMAVMQDSLQYLSIATEWLTAQCSAWGAEPEFIYDWSQDAALFYRAAFEGDMTDEDGYEDAVAYIEASVSSEELLEQYGADNILYIFYYNTSSSNRIPSWSYVYEADDPGTYYEVCNIFIGSSEGTEPPAVYAHEILHAFGAPDLYAAEEDGGNCGITQEYVEYCASTDSNDIMYTVRDISTGQYVYDKITNEFTALDAYYVGLADSCPQVEEWGLGESEYR